MKRSSRTRAAAAGGFGDFGDISLMTREARLMYRRFVAAADGGAQSLIVPIADRLHQPLVAKYTGADTVGLDTWVSDVTAWSNTEVTATTTADMALSATSCTFNFTAPKALLGGELFSVLHATKGWRLYRISRVVSGGTVGSAVSTVVQFRPPLREAATSGAALNFESPRCVMRIDGDVSETMQAFRFAQSRRALCGIPRRTMTYSVDDLAKAKRVGALVRIATPTPIRVWAGQVRELAIPSGGAETTDGAIYLSMGLLTDYPQLSQALNGEADRFDLSVSGVAITGEIASIAQSAAADIRGVAVDFALVLFDADWQLITPLFWLGSGTADSLSIKRSSDGQTRSLTLSVGNVFVSRRRPNLVFFTPIDQARRSSDDTLFSEVPKLQQGSTKVWGTG